MFRYHFTNRYKREEATLSGDYNLQRFLDAQARDYAKALSEVENGKKRSHWIWYIFPQLAGLGYSYNAQFYGISGRDEAAAYIAHPVLGQRLREICNALLLHTDKDIADILGTVDALKVRSCMTLFDTVSPDDVFKEVITLFYDGRRDERTLDRVCDV